MQNRLVLLSIPFLMAACSESNDGSESTSNASLGGSGAGNTGILPGGGLAGIPGGLGGVGLPAGGTGHGGSVGLGGALGAGGSPVLGGAPSGGAPQGGGGFGGSGQGGMSTGGSGLGGLSSGGNESGGMAQGGIDLAGGASQGGAASSVECEAGINTGSPCDPTIDSLCSRTQSSNPRDCICGDLGEWSCTSTEEGVGGSGMGGTSSGGAAGSGTGGSIEPQAGGAAGSGVAGSMTGGAAGHGSGGDTGQSLAENPGADCEVPDLPAASSLSSIEKLPDPFLKLNGERMTAKAEWRCRRQEILRQVEAYISGTKPPKPEVVSGSVTESKVSVHVEEGGQKIDFSADIDLPSGSGPFPAIINLGVKSPMFGFSLDETLVKSEGVAIIYYDHDSMGAQGGANTRGQGLFYNIYGSSHSASSMIAWAWGASRILDVLQQVKAEGGTVIDPERVAITGCSRNGKGAFTVGAFDQRFALTIPQESGTGGVPAWRIIPGEGAQTASNAYNEQPWLGKVFEPFLSSPTKLPIDTHEMVAMIAPRGLYVIDNPHIANLGPKSAHTAALAGAEVYAALGVGDAISYYSDAADGSHCTFQPEQKPILQQNIRRFLTQTESEPGVIKARSNATGNLEQWRDWDTPTLE